MAVAEGWKPLNCAECDSIFYKARALMKHIIVEHGRYTQVLEFNQKRIAEATLCETWQDFRIMMRGLQTHKKIGLCQAYMDGRAGGTSCCDNKRRLLQIMNYLNALARGGQIEPLSNLEKAELIVDGQVIVRIRK